MITNSYKTFICNSESLKKISDELKQNNIEHIRTQNKIQFNIHISNVVTNITVVKLDHMTNGEKETLIYNYKPVNSFEEIVKLCK